MGVEGPARSSSGATRGRPLLMEMNARLAGTSRTRSMSGVDLADDDLAWGTGQQSEPGRTPTGPAYQRTRWLDGDLRWLWDGVMAGGLPDSVPLGAGLRTFTSEFFRTRHYDFVDRRDMRPALAEVWDTAAIIWKQWVNRKEWREDRQQSQD